MKTVTCRIDLGYTRIAGYTLFDQETLEFQETTPKDVFNLMKAGQVNGLTCNEKGEIIPDMEKWNLDNMMIKSGVGNYRHFNSENTKGNTIYSVVRAIDIDGVGRFYEVINNRCSRIIFKESQLVVLSQLALVGGIRVNQETEEIELCEGVKVENHSSNNLFEIGNRIYVIQETEQTKATTLEELFGEDGKQEFNGDDSLFDDYTGETIVPEENNVTALDDGLSNETGKVSTEEDKLEAVEPAEETKVEKVDEPKEKEKASTKSSSNKASKKKK